MASNTHNVRNSRESNARFLNAVKEAAGCAKCGYSELGMAMEFDHIVPTGTSHTSRRNKYRIGGEASSKGTLAARVLDPNVQVLCGNCHNIKSALERLA